MRGLLKAKHQSQAQFQSPLISQLLGGNRTMRCRMIIAGLVAALALCIGLIAFIQPRVPPGKFPRELSDSEKRQIVSAAHSDARRQALVEIRRGQFRQAWRWIVHSRKHTVRSIGQQQEQGMIWVVFGVDDPGSPEGYSIWARYIMKREKGRWVINGTNF